MFQSALAFANHLAHPIEDKPNASSMQKKNRPDSGLFISPRLRFFVVRRFDVGGILLAAVADRGFISFIAAS
jgi:hypothetical protein